MIIKMFRKEITFNTFFSFSPLESFLTFLESTKKKNESFVFGF